MKVEDRDVAFGPADNGIYLFPPGAHSDEAHVQKRKVQWNDDGSMYFHPTGAVVQPPQPTQPPKPQPLPDVQMVDFPGLGPHPVIDMKPKQVYSVIVPYAVEVMAVQAGGTFDNTVTDLELTGSVVPGDRNYCNTPEAIFAAKGRDGKPIEPISKPAYAYGDAHASGVRISWAPAASPSTFAYPKGETRAINFYSEKGGSCEFFVQGK